MIAETRFVRISAKIYEKARNFAFKSRTSMREITDKALTEYINKKKKGGK